MRHPFLIGEKVYLRALEASDINENYLSWINDAEVTKYMTTGRFPSNMEKLVEYYQHRTASSNHVIFAIIDKESDRHIGNITLNNINWVNRTADSGIMIGEKDFWGKGYGTEAIRLVSDYAFKRLNLHKVTAGIVAIHQASIKAFEKAGFEIEGQAKSQFFLDGQYYDSLYLGITKEYFLRNLNSM